MTSAFTRIMSGISKKIYYIALLGVVGSVVALAYGIWAAWADAEGPNRLIVPYRVDQPGIAQLFYDRGLGIREADSEKRQVFPGPGLTEVVFPVPRLPLREVRFDPFSRAGKFTLGRPRLETASGRFVAKFPITAIVARHQIAGLQVKGLEVSGETTADADDPQLTFALGSPLRVGSPRVPWPEGLVLLFFVYLAWRFHPPPLEKSR